MAHQFDIKAIVYGIGVFVLGYLALSVLATISASAANPTVHSVVWTLIPLGAVVVSGAAGYVAAYRASVRPILNGTMAGSIGVATLICAVAYFFPEYPAWGIPLVVAVFALVAALGAIFATYRRAKVE